MELARTLDQGVVAATSAGFLLSGRTYRAEVVGAQLVFTPIAFQSDGRWPAQEARLALRLQRIVSGDGELQLEPSGMPRQPGGSLGKAVVMPFAQASLLQTLVARPEGVALDLWLLQPPERPGDLRFEFSIEADLAELSVETRAGTRESLRLGGVGRVSIGRALAVDARGEPTDLQMELAAGTLSIVLPEELLARAQYPLRIDPLISSSLSISGPGLMPSARPDVAFDPFSGQYIVVWERAISSATSEVWAARLTADGAPLGIPFPVAASASVRAERPRIAVDPDSGNYLVAFQDQPAGSPGATIRWSLLDASDQLLSSQAFALAGFTRDELPDVGFVRDAVGPAGFVLTQRRLGTTPPDSWVQVSWIDRASGALVDSMTVPTDVLRRDGAAAVTQLTQSSPAVIAFHRLEADTQDVEVFATCVMLVAGQLSIGTPLNLSNDPLEPDGLPDLSAGPGGLVRVAWLHGFPTSAQVQVLGRELQADCSQLGSSITNLTPFGSYLLEPALLQGSYAGPCSGQALALFAASVAPAGQTSASILSRRWDPATGGLGVPEALAFGQPGVNSYSTPRGALDTNSSTLPRFLVVFDDNGFGSQVSPSVIGQLYTFDKIPVSAVVTPSMQTVCDGDGIALDVAVTGTGPFTYQWRHDGTPIPGASSSALVLSGLTAAEAGSYDVLIEADCGSLISSACSVSVDSALASVGIDGPATACPGAAVQLTAQVLGGSGALTYQWSQDGTPLGGAMAASYAIPAMQGSDIGSYSVSVANACGTIVSASHVLGLDEAPAGAGATASSSNPCVGDQLTLTASAASGTQPFQYQWLKDGAPLGPPSGSAQLTLGPLTVQDAGAYAVSVGNACGQATSLDVSVSIDEPPANVSLLLSASQVCTGAAVTLSVPAATGSGVLTYEWLHNGQSLGAPSPSSSLLIAAAQPAQAGTYEVIVANACGAVTSAPVVLGLDEAPAGAGASASSSNPCVGDQLTLTASAASGTQPFQYQWLKDGAPLGPPSGNAQLTLGPLTVQDAGAYAVSVSNACGQATSLDVSVSIDVPPANVSLVISAPLVCTGVAVTLSVPAATGSGVLTYEWLHNGQSLGAPSQVSSLLIAAAQPAQAGTYEVIVANACGAVTSAPVVLAVIPPPSTYCTAKPNSLGCNAQMTWSGNPSASAGSGFDVSFGPIPGANPGLFIYTTQGAAGTPIQNGFGFLCLQPGGFFRTPASGSGGSSGTCSGVLTIDFNLYFANQTSDPSLVAGAAVDMQCWYRDPPNPGTANLSNAIRFTMCP